MSRLTFGNVADILPFRKSDGSISNITIESAITTCANALQINKNNYVWAILGINGFYYFAIYLDTVYTTNDIYLADSEYIGRSLGYVWSNVSIQPSTFVYRYWYDGGSNGWDQQSSTTVTKDNVTYRGIIGYTWSSIPEGVKIIYTGNKNIYVNNVPLLVYNYVPIDNISGHNTTTRLSMIKADFTNHGETMSYVPVTNIQRFTDNTNVIPYLYEMSVNEIRRIAYTDINNYVALNKINDTQLRVEFYQDGLHLTDLDLIVTGYYISSNEYRYFYFSLLVDTTLKRCRPSFIEVQKNPNEDIKYFYNRLENVENKVSDENQQLWYTWLGHGFDPSTPSDPLDYGGISIEGGGEGSFDGSTDTIDVPTLPALSAVDSGFVTIYNPTLTQVKSLASYMWSDLFSVDTFKKIFANPMDCIIGLNIVPCSVPVSGVENVRVGNITTGVTMNKVSEQFIELDCGTITLNPYWGSYLDYEPYTKLQIQLPYIGCETLSVDDCMGKAINVKYHIDLLTGSCVCFITCDGSLMYQYTGNVSSAIPLTSVDYGNTLSSLIGVATTGVGMATAIATGGITAPMVAVGMGSTANNVMNGKPQIAKSGSITSVSGLLSNQKPYLILSRARQCLPKDYNKFGGYPSYITEVLSSLTGYTEVETIHLENMSCTDSERSEIERLLTEGVIL